MLGISACGGGTGTSSSPPPPPPPPSGTFDHVVLVMEENHSYTDVIGNSSMPYLNSLAQQYGVAAQYYANAHPSMPNYLMLTTGQIESYSDTFNGVVSDDNAYRELSAAGKSWKAYAESLPNAGYIGPDVYPYLRRHNPVTYMSDVQNNAPAAANIVPFTQFATDLANNSLPQFSYIAPDALDDAHDGTLQAADSWLQSNIAPLLANSAFQKSGLLIIAFDESETSDTAHGGGHVPAVIISSSSKKGYVSQSFYQHRSTLRLILKSSGVTVFPGASSTAPDMTEFFQ